MGFEGKQVVSEPLEAILMANQQLRNELAQLKSKVTYRVYEENMNLVDEIVKLKAELNKNRPFGPVEEVPDPEFKYTLIVSQYYHSRHMYIVHHATDFIEKARGFSTELMIYKRPEGGKLKEFELGDFDYWGKKERKDIAHRYNINDYGDIYFIQSNYSNYLAGVSREYKADSIRESKGYIKKAVLDAIGNHHDSRVIKGLVEKYFTLA